MRLRDRDGTAGRWRSDVVVRLAITRWPVGVSVCIHRRLMGAGMCTYLRRKGCNLFANYFKACSYSFGDVE